MSAEDFVFRKYALYLSHCLLQTELNTVHSDLKHYEAMAQLGLLGAEDSDSFRLDCKPQPSNDLNIRLRDELQRCLAGEKWKFRLLLLWQQHHNVAR
jgi:hypothetical protein